MSAQRLGRQLSYGGSGSLGVAPAAAADRFSLLLLEDGEYFFKAHTAYYWPEEQQRVVGSLKVCSRSLFFVPRDLQQPIHRIPYQHTTAVTALDEPSAQGEDQLEVAATQRVEMKAGGVDAPYVHRRGAFSSRFSLVYACAEDVLPLVEELCLLCHASTAAKSKEERAGAALKLQGIIREHEQAEAFNPGWLEDEESAVVEAVASAVSPLAAQPGRAVLTQRAIYFQPFNLQWSAPLQAYALGRVVALAPRVYQLEDLGLEVFFSARHSLYLAFRSPRDRDAFRAALAAQPAVHLEKMRSREQWTRDWVHGRVSNFDYLMHLNREAGRSFKDLSQYPVMPWVLADYTSPTLDLADPAVYRDLSRPVGALNPRRLADFQQRYAELKQMAAPPARQAPGAPPPLDTPPFLYGCHYSSPGYVVFYLMRSNPELMLRLQNGRFDAPDRLFWSVADTWQSVLSLPSDVKELVPEFYSNDTSFLVNKLGTDFGCRAGGQRVGDVALPPWAADPADFLYKLQEALESRHVSARLHKWVDLVFGRKSRGAAAERAHNVFHYLTYDEVARDFLDRESDPGMRDALRLQMMEFGRTPRQLFTRKHPKRRVLGRGGVLACFGCLAAPVAQLQLPRSSTTRLGRPFDGRAIPPVSRAVFKLSCSPKADKRAALLAFLEQAAAAGEPEALSLRQTSGAELFLLVKAARDAKEGRPSAPGPAPELHSNLVRAAAALATCPQNRRYILEAGCLDAVAAALGAPDPQLAAAAVAALAQLAREDSPRLAALDRQPLAQLLGVLRQPPGGISLLAALEAVTLLAEAYPAHRSFFARQDLLGLLLQHLHVSRPIAAAAEASSPKGQPVHPLSQEDPLPSHRSLSRALRRRSTVAGPPGAPQQAPEVHPALLQRQQLLALAALLLDDAQVEALLASGALTDLLADCSSGWAEVRGGVFECLASLAAHDALRRRAPALGLLPLLLRGTGDASLQVQQPAAACIASLCSDPAALLEQAGGAPGVRPLVALASSRDAEVQRHAAAALWHLAVHPEARRAVVEADGLQALLTLARLPRNVAARELALQALLRCSDDEATRQRLDAAAAAMGLDQGQLSAMLSPASARSSTGSFLRKPRHRKMCSDVPSSFSGAVSRTSSFRSGVEHGSPAFAAGGSADNPWRRRSSPDVGAAASPGSAASLHLSPSSNGQASAAPAAQPADGSGEAGGAANGSPAAQQHPAPLAARTRLRLPEGPPLPLPIITPVPVPAGDSPAAKRHPGRDLPLSGAAAEAAAASPKGEQGVQNRVLQLERLASHPVPFSPE